MRSMTALPLKRMAVGQLLFTAVAAIAFLAIVSPTATQASPNLVATFSPTNNNGGIAYGQFFEHVVDSASDEDICVNGTEEVKWTGLLDLCHMRPQGSTRMTCTDPGSTSDDGVATISVYRDKRCTELDAQFTHMLNTTVKGCSATTTGTPSANLLKCGIIDPNTPVVLYERAELAIALLSYDSLCVNTADYLLTTNLILLKLVVGDPAARHWGIPGTCVTSASKSYSVTCPTLEESKLPNAPKMEVQMYDGNTCSGDAIGVTLLSASEPNCRVLRLPDASILDLMRFTCIFRSDVPTPTPSREPTQSNTSEPTTSPTTSPTSLPTEKENSRIEPEYGDTGVYVGSVVVVGMVMLALLLIVSKAKDKERLKERGGMVGFVNDRLAVVDAGDGPTFRHYTFTLLGRAVTVVLEPNRRLGGGGRVGAGIRPGSALMSGALGSLRDLLGKSGGGSWRLGAGLISSSNITVGTQMCEHTDGAKMLQGKMDGNRVALKEVKPVPGVSFAQEICVLMDLEHPCLARVFGAVLPMPPATTMAMVVIELAKCSLDDVLKSANEGSSKYAVAIGLAWMEQTASALTFLHAKRVAHTRLKPANVLIDQTGNAKLTDVYGTSQWAILPERPNLFDPPVGDTDSLDILEVNTKSSKTKKKKKKWRGPLSRESELSDVCADDIYGLGMLIWAVLHHTTVPKFKQPSRSSSSPNNKKSVGGQLVIAPEVPRSLRVVIERAVTLVRAERLDAQMILDALTHILGNLSAERRGGESESNAFVVGDVVRVWNVSQLSFFTETASVTGVFCETGQLPGFRVTYDDVVADDNPAVSRGSGGNKSKRRDSKGMLVDATNLLLVVDIEPIISMA